MLTLHPMILTVPVSDRQLTGRKKVQHLSTLARRALARSCQVSGVRLDTLPKDEKGAPLPINGVHWSLTHKSDAVGAVAAPLPVGIDLEIIRPISFPMFAKVADEKQWALLTGDRQRNFFRLWTAKEAVLKAVGQGIAGLTRCRVVAIIDDTHMELIYEGVHWVVEQAWFANRIAAVTPYDFDVHWTWAP